MKKVIAITIAAAMLLLTSCVKFAEEPTTEITTEETTEEETSEQEEETTEEPQTFGADLAGLHEDITEAPTEAPSTAAPATQAPSTQAPATEAPTEAPATQAPATEAPTEAPSTQAPATEAPTEAPPTQAPATEAPAASQTTYIGGILIANKTYALPQSYNPGGLTSECSAAFYRMADAAAAEGLSLYVLSGFRSYETQAGLYSRYAASDGQDAADRYSARPGHSEHQTGLAIDVNSVSHTFADTAEGKWLAANCTDYGFILRYPQGKEAQTGYMYEPWHIRYIGDPALCKAITAAGSLEEYLGITSVYPN